MFIGRTRELAALDRLYQSDRFEFAAIYGRRRVGKTTLINQFINDKKAIYFMGVESNAKQNLENFSRSILEMETGFKAETTFLSFQAALEMVFQLAGHQRLVLVIDEYPYVARASASLASTLQLLIDQYKETSKLMLILCGSSMSYMEDHVLAYKAPLYGRRTAQMKILPFDFEEVCRCFPGYSAEEQALVYGAVGGTPQYLLQIDDRLSVAENIKNTFLDPTSALFEEPENLLKQEVREPALYNAIISAIANGASRLSEISSKVGENTNVCAAYLKNLLGLGWFKRKYRMVIRLPERLSMRSATIFSGSGTGLFHRTAQLFPAERKNWLFSGSSPIYQNTWEMFLNRSVCNIFGNCFWQADHLCFFQSWVVGGEQIPAKKNRRKLTLWVFRIKQRPCSVNVNGRMKRSIKAC